MSIMTLLPFIVLIGAMFLMTRSAKKKQQAAQRMRDEMQAGTGVRTIGGMYATVKEIHEDTVLLEVAPGVHAIYAKNAIGSVLADEEYNRILDGAEGALHDEPVVPDDASALTEASSDEAPATGDQADKIDLGKAGADADKPADDADDAADDADDAKATAEVAKDEKKAGGADAK
ncbi:preprotein translocase subunit YajC [Streptomyces halobius]|uniref:Preprotein translocase subunit YajC n=1 Tax=Streptomyces halobius TaxID=2879846 RepID=A0ABY4MFD6_9ACTN|nr:preprotein translocase subunit YajC [Streptomyces halobius]UQA96499.1 preprotein translocase subunit YajC [Streptomyces halobius]